MNAIEFLIKQHREAEQLFTKLESSSDDQEMLLIELAKKLAGHMQIEEEIFYPSVFEVDSKESHEALGEHEEAKAILDQVFDMDIQDGRFNTTLGEMKKIFLEHAKKEERNLFPRVRKEISSDELEDLYFEMQDLLDELEDQTPEERIA